MTVSHPCPLCDAQAPLWDVIDFNRTCVQPEGPFLPLSGRPVYYCLCPRCGFLFAPEFQDWTREQFLEQIYNDAYVEVDPEYVRVRPQGNRAMLNEALGAQKHRFTHLDFGGGDGRLSRLLREDGWASASWDPFFDPGSTLDGQTFDLITAFEVFEHAPRPREMMGQLLSAAREGSFIMFSTLTHDAIVRRNHRTDWTYIAPRNGHVSIFSRQALARLGDLYGYRFGSFTDNLHCFLKTAPDWARHLVA